MKEHQYLATTTQLLKINFYGIIAILFYTEKAKLQKNCNQVLVKKYEPRIKL